jgi:hypothetical protein
MRVVTLEACLAFSSVATHWQNSGHPAGHRADLENVALKNALRIDGRRSYEFVLARWD